MKGKLRSNIDVVLDLSTGLLVLMGIRRKCEGWYEHEISIINTIARTGKLKPSLRASVLMIFSDGWSYCNADLFKLYKYLKFKG